MKEIAKILYITTFFLLVAVTGNCQLESFSPDEILPNQVFVDFGFEPEVVTTIGYTQMVKKYGGKADIRLGASVKFAPLIVSHGAWRINLISVTDWKMSRNWGTTINTSIYNVHNKDRLGVMDGLGFEIRPSIFHYGSNWTHGIDFGWQHTALLHISQSEEVKDTYNERYPDGVSGLTGPTDGWFGSTANRFRLGYVTSTRIDPHFRLQLEIGSLISLQKQGIVIGFSHGQVPLYFESLLAYQW